MPAIHLHKAIDSVPWAQLAHAYHRATDAPGHLRAFLAATDTTEEGSGRTEWLWVSVLHQGSVYSATVPVMWILAHLLMQRPDHPDAEDILGGLQTVAEALDHAVGGGEARFPVQCGDGVGQPLFEAWVASPHELDQDDTDYFNAAQVTPRLLVKLLTQTLPALPSLASAAAPDVRSRAVAACLAVARHVPGSLDGPLALLRDLVGDPSLRPGDWLSTAVGLGRLGEKSQARLDHGDPRMRLCAAMSPISRDDPRAIDVLASALSDIEWLESTYAEGVPHIDMHLRFSVLAELLARTSADSASPSVIDAVVHLLDHRASIWTADMEWGPILLWAFSDRRVHRFVSIEDRAPLPQSLSFAQHAVIEALCRRDAFWDPTSGNARLAFSRVQLPRDRQLLRSLLGA